MEKKLNFVRNGVIRLPPGFRFHPTDEELVVQYLKRKAFACPLPASIIPEVDVCMYDPWDLPGDCEQERYFFSSRKAKYRNGNRPNRGTASGYWKASGVDKQILASRSNQLVGMKKTLFFYGGKPTNGTRTDWVMHEYRLAGAGTTACIFPQRNKNSTQVPVVQMEDWVLCRIFFKKRSNRDGPDEAIAQPCYNNRVSNLPSAARPGFIDFMVEHETNLSSPSSSSSSSSASSGITEVSSSTEDEHDEKNTCNSVYSSPYRREA